MEDYKLRVVLGRIQAAAHFGTEHEAQDMLKYMVKQTLIRMLRL